MTPAQAAELWQRIELQLKARGITISDDDRASLIRAVGDALGYVPAPIEPDYALAPIAPQTHADEPIIEKRDWQWQSRPTGGFPLRVAPRPTEIDNIIDMKLKAYLDRAHMRRGHGYDLDDGVEY